jgi:hypothetical protein
MDRHFTVRERLYTSALASFVTWVLLVDDINTALAANNAAIGVALF